MNAIFAHFVLYIYMFISEVTSGSAESGIGLWTHNKIFTQWLVHYKAASF